MSTSGTYAFNPSMGELVLHAFQRVGVRPTALVQEHFQSARMATNLVLQEWSNHGVNLWKVALFSTSLVQGTATYTVDPSIVLILDAYIEVTAGSTTTDRLILPVSRSEYASFPNKSQQGIVTSYWHDRVMAPTVSLYYVPDGTQPTMKYYAMQQVQDAAFTGAQTLDIPPPWFKAFNDALSVELAIIWAPERVGMLQPIADRSFAAAASTGTETADVYLAPQIGGYFST